MSKRKILFLNCLIFLDFNVCIWPSKLITLYIMYGKINFWFHYFNSFTQYVLYYDKLRKLSARIIFDLFSNKILVSMFLRYLIGLVCVWGGARDLALLCSARFARALQIIISSIYPINFFSIKLIVCKDLKSGRP